MSNALIAYIGIGANLGDARANVAEAVLRLGRMPDSAVEKVSSLYRTAPIDSSGDDYINAVVRIVTGLEAHALLAALHRIEAEHGRERPYRNAPRTLDLDLLLYDGQQIGTPLLQVPHPRLQQRAFVLVPLLELAPRIDIPGLGPARQFSAAVADQAISKIT
ncbi:2-amino-4-hydroxy-6-hydroxymethyldihydropteridine diphosphokinase [Janthinobacterium agaricidamnosum]|uniref:2-amino-4-hydroxy-6-hydroxymethyldihydropteridine pyrophosphokinase n=1 Tax=Janthinobacterium agaricidamnosum NBRC 102515 = DSM 9628 TaxID=1349767 RepID=W0V1E2_9BURK|nr:2-amino-4-hydroxy-6-hydroxymethyldihydropteridine diphosphokinase [Janthinobacterium agaricidamnosum]CDG81158.1 2-amino-4-hydroxy-6-hydroxymethyldihydropteridinepyrophosphokinase [Janthinobacterium agaricidamnosum NBRC 102515 = DSM 9628]